MCIRDRYGTLAAGTWMMMGDDVPSESEVTDWFSSLDFSTYSEARASNEGIEIVTRLFQFRENVRIDNQVHTVTIGDLVDIARKRDLINQGTVKAADAEKALRQIGMRVTAEGDALLISNGSEWVSARLRDTPYQTGWARILKTIPAASAHTPIRFHSELQKSRGTRIPFAAIGSSES